MVKIKSSESFLKTDKEKKMLRKPKSKQKSNTNQLCNTSSSCVESTSKNDLPDVKHVFNGIVPSPGESFSKEGNRECDSLITPKNSQRKTQFPCESALVEVMPFKAMGTEGISVINCSYGTPVMGLLPEKNDIDVSFSQNSSDQDCELREVVTEIISDLSNENDGDSSKENNQSACGGQETSVPKVSSGVSGLDSDSPSSVLKGVVAYVEVRTEFEDTSRSVEKQLLRLGAQVSKLNKKVTHVVLMNGRRSTQKKAASQGCHMVSVLWVEMCRQTKQRVPEHLYPAMLDEDDDPLFPKKRKRFRCIQPKSFKDEFAASAERLKEIFSRVKSLNVDSVGSPLTSTPATDIDDDKEAKAKKSNSIVEETGTPLSQDKAPRPVVRKRKLFCNNDPRTTDFEGKSKEKEFLEKLDLQMKMPVKHVDSSNSNTIPSDNGPAKEGSISGKNLNNDVHKRKLNAQPQKESFKQQTNNNRGKKDISSKGNVTPHKLSKNKTVPSHKDSKNASRDEDSEQYVKTSLSSGNVTSLESISERCNNAFRDDTSNGNMTKDAGLNSREIAVRPKLLRDKGNVQKNSCISAKYTSSNETLKKHVKSSPKKVPNNVEKSKNVSHSSLDDFKDVENRHVAKKLKIATNTVSNVTKKLASKAKAKSPGRIVITSVPVNEEESLHSIIRSLGSFTVSETVTGSTTHVICGEKKRTLKVIFGIALGCWLISPEWVFKSLEAGCWLKEDSFELAEYYPAVQLSRLERYSSCSTYKRKLFQELGLIYISPCCNPPREKLTELVTMIGGKVTSSLKRCTIVVGTGVAERNGVRVVPEKWIFDCITRNEIVPITS